MRTPGAAAPGVKVPAGVPLTAILLAGVVVAAPCTAQDTPTARSIVASGELARQPNPVLLAFLLEECSDCLPADVRQPAVDQIVASLRERTLIQPMEQVGELMRGAMGMMSPAAMMKQALSPENLARGALGVGPGASAQAMQQRQIQGMQDALLDPLTAEQRDAVMGALLDLAKTRNLDLVASTGVVQGLRASTRPTRCPSSPGCSRSTARRCA